MTTDVPSGNGWRTSSSYEVKMATAESIARDEAAYEAYRAELKAKEDKRIDEALERARAVRAGGIHWQKSTHGPGSDEVKQAQADYNAAMSDRLDGLVTLTEGRKDDAGKPPLHLIPPEYLYAVAEILDYGQRKYSARNWESGMAWSRCYRAALGHLFDWFSWKGPDPETGKSHLWHAAASVMFLVCYEIRNAGTDDRPAPWVERPGPNVDRG